MWLTYRNEPIRQAGAPATIALHFVRAMLGVRVKRLVVALILVEKDK